MASSPLPLPALLVGLTTLILFLTGALAQVAPGPTPAPLNLTAILVKGGQYNTLLRLLGSTQVGVQLESQLNNSYAGLTIFAPTDNAFSNLKPGTLNALTNQEQVELVLAHVLPKYYTLDNFQTASNPLQTQGSSNAGSDTLNVTAANNQLNVSTGVDSTQVSNALYSSFPLALYPVDKVLLPYSLFGAKPPASAPPPSPAAPGKPGTTPAGSGAADGGPSSATTPSGASFSGRGVGWGFVVGVGLMAIIGSL